MTSLQVRYFLKVADCMSFSKAAEEMFVAQSSVSRQIQLLEKELGYQLFDRTRRHAISLTEAGMVFQDCFLQAQAGYERAHSTVSDMESSHPLSLKVGVGQNWNMTRVLCRFRDQVHLRYPQARLTFENLPFLQLHRQLDAGHLDVIFCTKTSVLKFDDLEVYEIGQLEGRAYVLRGLLRPEHEELRIEDFDGQTLLMLPEEEAPMSMQIVQLQFYAHQVRVFPQRMPNRDTIHQALLMGDGFSVFDEFMWLADDPQLTWLRLEDMIPMCMVWKKSNRNPLIYLLADTVEKEWAEAVH